MVLGKDRIDGLIEQFLRNVRPVHALKKAYLFGSYARGTATEASDVDLVLVFDHLDRSGLYDEAFTIFHEAQMIDPILGACRRNVIEAKNRVERGQISSISKGNSESIVREIGGIWTAQTVLQPITHFSDRLLEPIYFSTDEFSEGRMTIIREIKQTGIELSLL